MLYRGIRTEGIFAAILAGLLVVFACASSANGQAAADNNLKMLMNGSLGIVYAGNSGNYMGSSHSLGFGLNGTMEGYYFNPQFLSFQVRPYYDRAQFNSESQTITRGTGVDGSVSIFGGSHFPGVISYGKNFNSNSEFRIAGVPSVLVNSSGSNMSVSWGALFDGYPTLQATYSIADSASTLLGSTERSKSSSKSFNLNSNYSIGGFNLQGRLGHYNTDLMSPSFLTGESTDSTSSITNYGVSASRRLPLSGSLGLGWSRTTSRSAGDDLTSNSYMVSAGFSPWRRLSISSFLNYSTNLIVELERSLLGDANISPLARNGSDSNSLYMNATGTFSAGHGITFTGYANHRIQHFLGEASDNTQYGATVNFQKANNLFGFLRFSVGVVNTATKEGNNAVGLVTTVGVTHKYGKWEGAADFDYSQNTQTLFDIVTTSNYSYGGLLRRKINSSASWSTSFRESRSGLTSQAGNRNLADSAVTNFSWERYSFSGSYSRSNGQALLTSDGTLTATPLGSIISNYYLTFNARSYAITASTQLFRLLTLSGSYTNVSSNSAQNAFGTFSNGNRFNARLGLRMRRLYIIGGFDRAIQESSAIAGGPRRVNSYYVSLSRWFNVF